MQPKQTGLPRLPLGVLYLLVIASAGALASLACATLNQPLTSWRTDIARRAELVREKLSEGPALRREHAEQQRELENLMTRVEEVNRRIPDEPREGEFLADLTRLAGEYGVAIEDFRRGVSESTETHSLVSVSVNVRGDYRGICGLIEGVSKLPRLAELTQLTVRREAGDASYPVNLTYALYYGLVTAGDASSDAAE